ncbi:MAG TPA: hypothetical protein VIV11_33755 [Kofleriaceae bacterium]
MRWLTLAPLLAATGCNWIFGLEETVLVDAPGSELPPTSHTGLVWAIATTDGVLSPSGVDPVLEYKAIGSETALRPKQPSIMVGDEGGLMMATYNLADGTFEIPFDLRDSPHRIVYTLPDEAIAHEVQWSKSGARLVVPRTTRFEAPLVPSGSGYTITPMGLTSPLVAPALFTSGVFTYSNQGTDFNPSGPVVTFPFAQEGMPLTPPFGAPQSGPGDWVLLTEWVGNGPTSNVSAFAKTQLDLVAGTMSMPATEPMWTSTARALTTSGGCGQNCLPSVPTAQPQMRLVNTVGAGTQSTQYLYGVSPSTDLPGFLPGVPPMFIERPLILPFVESNILVSNVTLADPSDGLGLERVVAVRLSNARMVNGATLTSSIQGITNVLNAPLQLTAPLAINVQLGSANLSTAMDGAMIVVGSGMQTLQFASDGTTADDYVITLFQLTGSALAPLRHYHVIAPEVKIDTSLLVSGSHYVFAITARTGIPGAKDGIYDDAQYPFGSATTFTKTFIVQ